MTLSPPIPFARETAAGYDPAKLHRARGLLAGAGALANSVAMNLALVGFGDMATADKDVVDSTNITRSPLFAGLASVGKPKAKLLAQGFLNFAYAPEPKARYAIERVEALGLGAFQGMDVVISCVDNFATRAYLATATRLLGIPFIEAGFKYPWGNMTVSSSRDPAAACWACGKAGALEIKASCTLYSRAVQARGGIPATQPLASTFGSLVAEAAIKAIHGEFPLDGKMLELNISTGESRLTELAADPECISGHRRAQDILNIGVSADEPATKIFEALAGRSAEPLLHLPHTFLVEAPCKGCSKAVVVRRPLYMVSEAPSCPACTSGVAPVEVTPGMLTTVTTVSAQDHIANTRARKLGLPPGAVFEVEDGRTCESFFVRLSGGIDELFVLKTGRGR